MTDTGSSHYKGDQGNGYFAYQSQGGLHRGRIDARKFAPYVEPSDTVLDFGCGNGSLLYHLNCKHRIGLDMNPVAREAARELGLEVHVDPDAVADDSVNLIISNHALEHVLCPLHTMTQLRTKLVPSGRLVLCLPMDDWRTQKNVNVQDINHHLYTWTPLLIGNLLDEAGFAVERAWVVTHAWPPHVWQQLDSMLPVWLFDLVCRFTAWIFRRRQVMALARKR